MAAPSTQALLTEWNWEPSVLVGLGLLTVAYVYAVGPFRRGRRGLEPASREQTIYFGLSVLILVAALLSPLDAISDRYLFSAHMVQHLLLATLWPPLLLLATPPSVVRSLFRIPGAAAVVGFFSYPAVAIILFNLDIYLWHLPVLYDLTLRNEGVHIVEHLTFMFFGIFNWWPLLSPIREQRLSYPAQVLYLFLDGMLMMVLGIVFTFSPQVFYSGYTSAPRLWGISPGADQQFGGLIMWYPGNVPYAVLLVIAFYRWFDDADPSRAGRQNVSPQSHTIDSPLS